MRIPYTNFDKIEDIIKIELGLLIKLGDYKLTSNRDKNFYKLLDHFEGCNIGKVRCNHKPNCYENFCE